MTSTQRSDGVNFLREPVYDPETGEELEAAPVLYEPVGTLGGTFVGDKSRRSSFSPPRRCHPLFQPPKKNVSIHSQFIVSRPAVLSSILSSGCHLPFPHPCIYRPLPLCCAQSFPSTINSTAVLVCLASGICSMQGVWIRSFRQKQKSDPNDPKRLPGPASS